MDSDTLFSAPKRSKLPLLVVVGLGTLTATILWLFWLSFQAPPPPSAVPGVATTQGNPPATVRLPLLSPNLLPVPVPPPDPAPVVLRIPTDQPVVFVTIDDGVWHPSEGAQYIIQHKIPISAFLTTSMVGRDPGYFTVLQQHGASIANHTVTHPHMDRLTYTDQRDQICGASEQLQRWYGVSPTLFRPPYGEYNVRTRQAAASCGIKWVVLWSAVLDRGKLDYQFKPGHLRPGDIVLLHFRPELKHDLEVLMRAAQAQGLQLAQLQDYLP